MRDVVDDFLGEWQAFRQAREARLTAPHGFLSITGLHWLDDTPRRYDGVPGAWWVGDDGVEVELGAGESLTLDGCELTGRQRLGRVDEAGIRVLAGEQEIEVADRDGAVILRPRDPAHPLRTGHRATPTYPPSRDWVLPGSFRALEGGRPDEEVVGEVTFTVGGEQVSLLAYDNDGGLWLVFADATSGRTTYPAGRQLAVPSPAADGTVTLDFNRTTNLPCAYTAFTTCPVPLPQNRLQVAIEAGEQDPSVVAAQE
jgi:uncharacterized protein